MQRWHFVCGLALLAVLLLVWAAYAAVQTAALALSVRLARGVDDAAAQSLNTSRLAVVGSTIRLALQRYRSFFGRLLEA